MNATWFPSCRSIRCDISWPVCKPFNPSTCHWPTNWPLLRDPNLLLPNSWQLFEMFPVWFRFEEHLDCMYLLPRPYGFTTTLPSHNLDHQQTRRKRHLQLPTRYVKHYPLKSEFIPTCLWIISPLGMNMPWSIYRSRDRPVDESIGVQCW